MISKFRLGTALVGAVLSVLILTAPVMAAGDANMEACPNESLSGFRAGLPDCRAYEMVSPPFKDGQEPREVLAVSSNGSRMLDESLGAFAGTESDSEDGAVYEFRRLGSGWATSAVSPAASLFPTDVFLSASADLGSTLWAVRGSGQSIYADDMYVREPDGTFVKVGPMVPPSAELGPSPGGDNLLPYGYLYAGASSDLSHVLFEIRADSALWPGDTTAESTATSLYEYVGTNNVRPELVGVNAEGHLISDCGTTLGGESETYNAVSSSGETVFFTSLGHSGCATYVAAPSVSELYARLGQIETVPISEPTSGQCAECNTTVKAPAEFQGASEDGSKVVFLTEQELLAGSSGMNLYEYDFDNRAGHKIVRVSSGSSTPEVQGVVRVSEDGSHAYFVAKGVLTATGTGTLTSGSRTVEDVVTSTGAFAVGQRISATGIPANTTISAVGAETLELSAPATASATGVGLTVVNREGNAPTLHDDNLYVFERDAAHPGGSLRFVTTLSGGDSADWKVQDIRPAQATPDGRFLVFDSVADLTPGDTSSEPQVFEYDALEEKLVRASVGQAGYPEGTANANAYGSRIPGQEYSESRPTTANTGLAVSSDGASVVFTSSGGLTPQALNDVRVERCSFEEHGVCVEYETEYAENVYEYRDGDVYLVSEGRSTNGSFGSREVGVDPSGGDVFFSTADPLLPQDVDTQYDVYDARSDGGFPAPATPAGCEGEACQGNLLAAPVFGSPGSVAAKGGGNLAPPPVASPPIAKPKPLTRAQKLAKARKACRAKHNKHQRAVCEAQARKKYASKSNVNAKGKR